jgi:hypothetical protein
MITGPPSFTSTLISDGLEGGVLGDVAGFVHDRKASAIPMRKREHNAKRRVPRPKSSMVVSGSAVDRKKNQYFVTIQ